LLPRKPIEQVQGVCYLFKLPFDPLAFLGGADCFELLDQSLFARGQVLDHRAHVRDPSSDACGSSSRSSAASGRDKGNRSACRQDPRDGESSALTSEMSKCTRSGLPDDEHPVTVVLHFVEKPVRYGRNLFGGGRKA
jgi:hypothetical protein